MGKIPGQRKPGQTGGRHGQSMNAATSRARGGSPRAGGGGGGKKGGGCVVVLLALPATALAFYGGAHLLG